MLHAHQIRRLPQNVINRIAAGEVLESPASALKELLENALDSGAENIEIKIEAGGKNLICVCDDGHGMTRENLQLAVLRHATSKLHSNDLLDIKHFGFRGEALPAIGAVAKLKITSKRDDACFRIEVIGGEVGEIIPSHLHADGTKVEVRDLFYATPARLKFLKSVEVERAKCVDVVKKFALVNPDVKFALEIDGKKKFVFQKNEVFVRVAEVLGDEFLNNSVAVKHTADDYKITGLAGLPTYNRRASDGQHFYINKRLVRDKFLQGAVKTAYADFMGGGRFPVMVLFIELPNCDVDVNVHPAKSEVRFKSPKRVMEAVAEGLKEAIAASGCKTSSVITDFAMHAFNKNRFNGAAAFKEEAAEFIAEPIYRNHPLGQAKCQIDDTYIIAETGTSLVIVDQHAAHERLVYEKFKSQVDLRKLQRHVLMKPKLVALDAERLEAVLEIRDKFAEHGFVVEKFDDARVILKEIPVLLVEYDMAVLFGDIADEIIEHGSELSLTQAFEHVFETSACHNSIRAGQKLSQVQMNNLLREMESTPFSAQCNHGRPTYVELKFNDIEKLFGRK